MRQIRWFWVTEAVIRLRRSPSTDMYRTFIPAITPLAVQSQPSWWFAFVGNKLLICPEGKVS
ncbi:MAG: hypothetical protein HC862_29250 [Scytonema sp. RU_4_4]|nr:hypothetical protein [Scytonema sp. RU_4_4]